MIYNATREPAPERDNTANPQVSYVASLAMVVTYAISRFVGLTKLPIVCD